MATRTLAVVPRAALEGEIEQILGAPERIEAALAEVGKDLTAIESDAARQFAAQSAGKSPSETATLAVTVEKAATARRDQALEKKRALEFLSSAVSKRLEQWRTSAPDELIAVLDRKIAEQTPIVGQEQAEATRAQAILDRLKRERSLVRPRSSTAAAAAPVAPAGGRTAAAPPTTTAAPTTAPAPSTATGPATPPASGRPARGVKGSRRRGSAKATSTAAPSAAAAAPAPPTSAPSPAPTGTQPAATQPTGGAGGRTP